MTAQIVLRQLESVRLLMMTGSLFLCTVTRQQMEEVCPYDNVYVLQSLVVVSLL